MILAGWCGGNLLWRVVITGCDLGSPGGEPRLITGSSRLIAGWLLTAQIWGHRATLSTFLRAFGPLDDPRPGRAKSDADQAEADRQRRLKIAAEAKAATAVHVSQNTAVWCGRMVPPTIH